MASQRKTFTSPGSILVLSSPNFSYPRAIGVARRQSAKSWELRASSSLARLWQKQGKVDEAGQMLGEIYGWFSEGFDTPDLREARALLKEFAEDNEH